MPRIWPNKTLEQVEAELREQGGGRVWYGVRTCWWTHRRSDLGRLPSSDGRPGLPCDPRGSPLMMTGEGEGLEFSQKARENPGHYGRHGLRAFIGAHNDNCRVDEHDSPATSMESWDMYNNKLDGLPPRHDGRLRHG